MNNWDEIKTAYQVARMGTVSGAAEVLGVHHATVIRHIDALEGQLGVKLFQRHARGYTATEVGDDLWIFILSCRISERSCSSSSPSERSDWHSWSVFFLSNIFNC